MKPFTALLFALIVALLAVRNLPWHLDDKDQAKQAFTSFEMIERGQWWFQHTPTGKVATKPPLAGWISAALSPLGWDIAWRLPGFLCALATLAILWRAPQGGLIAAAAFGLNHFTQRLATLVRTDMLLAFFIFIAGWLVWKKVREAQPWTSRDRWMLFLTVLASMLTKGPIAYAFLLPGLLAFWWMCRRAKAENLAWAGWWPWFGPLLVFAAWAGLGIWQSPVFYKQVVEIEFLGRFTVGEAAVHRNHPVYFYLANVLAKFAPWSVLLLALHFRKDVRAALAKDPARLWLVCWALGGLVFMSLVPSKRADRIFPVIPPLCLLLAATVAPLAAAGGSVFWRLAFGVWRLALSPPPAPALRNSQGMAAARGSTPNAKRQTPNAKLMEFPGATVLALLITLAAAAWEITSGYRRDQGGLVRFGNQARAVAAAHPGRLAVLSGKDEGMLLYTHRPEFTKPGAALAKWRAGEIDWLVLSEKDFAKRGRDFEPHRKLAEQPLLPEKSSGYVLLERIQR